MSDLAENYLHEGKYDQSDVLLAQTLELEKRVLGPEDPLTALPLFNLGDLEARRGNRAQAITLLSQSVDHGLPPYADLAIEKVTDLTSLHGDPRFAALVAHAKQVAEAKQKAAATQAAK
jgi:hypothetical protein